MRAKQNSEPTYKKIATGTKISEMVMPLVLVNDNEIIPMGTCVPIAGNLVLTARHVIEGAYAHLAKKSYELWGIQIISTDPIHYGIWTVKVAYNSPITDISLVKIDPYNEEAAQYGLLNACQIDVIPPPIGSEVTAFGYGNQSGQMDKNELIKNYKLNYDNVAATGIVAAIHEPKRDNNMLNFPCFQVNGRFDKGMSGGPIFNQAGHLCGLICSSFDEEKGKEKSIAYGATLWPAMATLIEFKDKKIPALELFHQSIVRGKNWYRIKISKNKTSIDRYLDKKPYS